MSEAVGDAAALSNRLRSLQAAVTAATGRAEPTVLAAAEAVVQRAGARVAFSGGYSVIALAGATGSGKSSLFNAVTGTELARVAVRRPTTAKAMAVSWGNRLPHELLDWLDVTSRKLGPGGPAAFADLVLLDLPDHDSTESSHRLAVDRLVDLVDALIWVVDPEKYADAALHQGYLRRLAPHAEVMMVVLNQSDRLAPAQLDECLADLRRLLDSEGLRATPIMATSALHRTGIQELREAMARTVAAKQAMARRLTADVKVAAGALAADLGQGPVPKLDSAAQQRVEVALGEAAGVPVVVDRLRQSWRRRGQLATGWPLLAWLGRLRPDPLRRLHLERVGEEVARTSLPAGSAVQRARAELGITELVDAAAAGLGADWVHAIRKAAGTAGPQLFGRLDEAIARVDLDQQQRSWWWGLVTALQWALLVSGGLGLGWLLGQPILAWLGLPPLPVVTWAGVPAATWLLLGGVIGGLLLSLAARALVGLEAAGRARAAERELATAIGAVVAQDVVAPVQSELDRLATARAAAQAALAG